MNKTNEYIKYLYHCEIPKKDRKSVYLSLLYYFKNISKYETDCTINCPMDGCAILNVKKDNKIILNLIILKKSIMLEFNNNKSITFMFCNPDEFKQFIDLFDDENNTIYSYFLLKSDVL